MAQARIDCRRAELQNTPQVISTTVSSANIPARNLSGHPIFYHGKSHWLNMPQPAVRCVRNGSDDKSPSENPVRDWSARMQSRKTFKTGRFLSSIAYSSQKTKETE
jgi:hypothetical protein